MEKNISIVGRLLRILIGVALLCLAYRLLREKPALRKLAIGLAVGGFVGVAQGYHGVCLVRALGFKTPV